MFAKDLNSKCSAGAIKNKSVQLLAYADDIDIIDHGIGHGTAAFERESAKVGVAVNEGKTKYMVSKGEKRQPHHWLECKCNFEVVEQFFYLGEE